MMVPVSLYCLIAIFLTQPCLSFEPLTSLVGVISGVVISVSYAGYEYTKCKRYECCDDSWIKLNFSGLQSDFKRSLHGQHLAEDIVARSVRGHYLNKNPKKALVMSFHGWTGSGKNFVSNLIAKNLYAKELKSSFIHWYIATQHFPHASEVENYKKKLQKEIQEYTQLCGRSLFVFDEMDKMPSGVIDVIKPYIDFHEKVDGVDYRKNIFIFLSNAGGSEITKVSFRFWLDGKEREDITMKDLEPLMHKGAFNEEGGLYHSDIVEKNLIDVNIPFLPLEKKHVKLCVRDELRTRFLPLDDKLVNKVANDLEYYPAEFEVYSSSGCKKVSQKIDIYTVDDHVGL